MWTDAAAITKQLSDEEVERASTRRRPYSFLHDLDPAARERLDELEEQIDSGKVKLRNGRPGRPATDAELRHRRRELPLPKVQEDTKAERIAAALRSRPDETYVEIAASLGVSYGYVKAVARTEGVHRPKGPRSKHTRERIIDLVLGGYTVEQVALRLEIPEATVRFYCRSSGRILSGADERREAGSAGPIARDDPARAQGAA